MSRPPDVMGHDSPWHEVPVVNISLRWSQSMVTLWDILLWSCPPWNRNFPSDQQLNALAMVQYGAEYLDVLRHLQIARLQYYAQQLQLAAPRQSVHSKSPCRTQSPRLHIVFLALHALGALLFAKIPCLTSSHWLKTTVRKTKQLALPHSSKSSVTAPQKMMALGSPRRRTPSMELWDDPPIAASAHSSAYSTASVDMGMGQRTHRAMGVDHPWLKRRYIITALCFIVTTICYADRTNIGIAIPAFVTDKNEQGLVLSAFFYGYLITQVHPSSVCH
jgi:hypothetical protein